VLLYKQDANLRVKDYCNPDKLGTLLEVIIHSSFWQKNKINNKISHTTPWIHRFYWDIWLSKTIQFICISFIIWHKKKEVVSYPKFIVTDRVCSFYCPRAPTTVNPACGCGVRSWTLIQRVLGLVPCQMSIFFCLQAHTLNPKKPLGKWRISGPLHTKAK
jgi:hypothetical protein